MNIIKRPYHIFPLVTVIAIFFTLFYSHIALAAIHPDDTEAYALKELGIFNGRENGFALEEKPNRVEAAVILLRLIGKEQEALAENIPNGFTDVPDWADAQIGYLYQKGLIKGMSETTFGNNPIDFNQMMTLILRALGYSEAADDFVWSSAAEKAVELSALTPWCYTEITEAGDFTRKELVSCIFCALQAPMKDSDLTLIRSLANDAVFTEDQIANTGISDLLIAADLRENDYQHYYLHQDFTITPTGPESSFELIINLPDNYYNRQRVIEHTFSIPPKEYYYADGSLFAVFNLDNIQEETELDVISELEISRYDLETAQEFRFPVQLSDEDREKYTSQSMWIDCAAPEFTDADISPTDDSEIALVKALMNYTLKKMKPELSHDTIGSLVAINRGYGDCWEYSLVFASLCRAHGIPARVVTGDCADEEATGHAIVEVFLSDMGWVPFDPVNTDTRYVTFNRLENDFIYLSDTLDDIAYYGYLGKDFSIDIKEYVSSK